MICRRVLNVLSGAAGAASELDDRLLEQQGVAGRCASQRLLSQRPGEGTAVGLGASRRLYEAAMSGPPSFSAAQREAQKRLAGLLVGMEEYELAAEQLGVLIANPDLTKFEHPASTCNSPAASGKTVRPTGPCSN